MLFLFRNEDNIAAAHAPGLCRAARRGENLDRSGAGVKGAAADRAVFRQTDLRQPRQQPKQQRNGHHETKYSSYHGLIHLHFCSLKIHSSGMKACESAGKQGRAETPKEASADDEAK